VRTRYRLALLGVVSALAAIEPLSAQEVVVPVSDQVQIFAKVLGYDRRHESRRQDELVVGIAFQSGFRASLLTREEVERELVAAFGKTTRVRLVQVELLPGLDLQAALERLGVEILYVTPLRSADLSLLIEATRSLGVLTITGVPEYVHQGLALGLDSENARPTIIINLSAARAEGADFGAELLKIVQVVGQ